MGAIHDIKPLNFASDDDTLTIEAAAATVVSMKLTADDGSVVYENAASYEPADGKICVNDVDELVNSSVLSIAGGQDILAVGARSAGLTLTVSAVGETASGRVLYMTRFMGGDMTPRFATQMRRRKVYAGQPQPVAILTAGDAGLMLIVGLAYKEGGVVRYQETSAAVDTSKDYYVADASAKGILSLFGYTPDDGKALLFYTLTLYSADGRQLDRLHCDWGGEMPRWGRQFVFLNMYGVPDCITFTGKDTEKQSLESDFGYAGREYTRLDALLTEEHEANSGWLGREQLAAVYELIESPVVYVIDEGAALKAVITDVDMEVESPRNSPINVAITWRYADSRRMRKPVGKADTGRGHVFERPPFDKTFD